MTDYSPYAEEPSRPASTDANVTQQLSSQELAASARDNATEMHRPERDGDSGQGPFGTPSQSLNDGPPAISEEPEEDEVSIEEYMSQMLARMGSGIQDELAPESEPIENTPVEPEPTPPLMEDGEVIPTSRPPENRSGLSDMRQIANETAQDALRTHSLAVTRRRLTRRLVGYAGFVFVATVTSSILALQAPTSSSMSYMAAVGLTFLAMLGVRRYSSMTKKLLVALPTEASDACPTGE